MENKQTINKKKEYNKRYIEKHKDEIYMKITCPECGISYIKANKTNHEKTNKHKMGILERKLKKIKEYIK
jgi:hypothetical protein